MFGRLILNIEILNKKKTRYLIFIFLYIIFFFISSSYFNLMDDFNFTNFFPFFIVLIVYILSFFQSVSDLKKSLFFQFLIILSVFFALNSFSLNSLSRFKDYPGVKVSNYALSLKEHEGNIYVHRYTVGSGRSRNDYVDVELVTRDSAAKLKIFCNFVDRYKSCPLLEKLDGSPVKIGFYSDSKYFSYPEVLLFSVDADNFNLNRDYFYKYYSSQKNKIYLYFIFVVLFSNLAILRFFIFILQYRSLPDK